MLDWTASYDMGEAPPVEVEGSSNVEVTDERTHLNPEGEPWHQDGIEVMVDARPDPERSHSRGLGIFGDYLFIGLAPGETPDQMVFHRRQEVPAGVRAACVRTATGHNTEIAIPVAYLDKQQGGAWTEFRLNIGVDDWDEEAGPLAQLWWRPDWRRAADSPGSGTFRRR